MEKELNFKRHTIFNNVMYFVMHFKKYCPMVLVLSGAEIVLGVMIPLIGIYLPKMVLELVEQEVTVGRMIWVLAAFTMLIGAVYGIEKAVEYGKYYKYNEQRTNLLGMLFLKSLRVKYEYTESGVGKIAYQKAMDAVSSGDWSASSRVVTGTITLITNVICFLLYSTVIGALNIWMVIALIGMSLINYFTIMNRLKYRESTREESAVAGRHFWYVRSVLGNTKAAKDIRIFNMNRWLIKQRDSALMEFKVLNKKLAGKDAWSEKMGFGVAMIRDAAAYGYLIYMAAQNHITISEFVLYFGAITGFSGFVMSIMDGVGELREAANSADYYRAYIDLPDDDMESGTMHINQLAEPITIEFKNVSFSYKFLENVEETNDGQETEQKIFDKFNLKINGGEKIALVGINGAGKTTLVKLLCGMYQPDSGSILINGIDRNQFPRKELYKLFSVVFQEPLILPFTVGENLAVSKAGKIDEKRGWQALERAGLRELFQEKNIDISSYMTKLMFKEGAELSGGQQQRFLLARALYKDGPVLVLDEPTAALDPIAESEVYENYNKYSKGKTAIFISHRLASTRFSDRIVMIDAGKILEMGSHTELMEKGGAYAGMYQVQSNYYNR